MRSISFSVSFLARIFHKGCLFIAIYLGRPCIPKTNDKNDFKRDCNNRKMLRLFFMLTKRIMLQLDGYCAGKYVLMFSRTFGIGVNLEKWFRKPQKILQKWLDMQFDLFPLSFIIFLIRIINRYLRSKYTCQLL